MIQECSCSYSTVVLVNDQEVLTWNRTGCELHKSYVLKSLNLKKGGERATRPNQSPRRDGVLG